MFEEHEYYKLYTNSQIRLRVYNNRYILISTQIDDILSVLLNLKSKSLQLTSSYKIKNLGNTKLILSIHINRNAISEDIIIFQ